MTQASAERRADRVQVLPLILEYLQTKSVMRYRSRPAQLRAAAKQIAMNAVATRRRLELQAA